MVSLGLTAIKFIYYILQTLGSKQVGSFKITGIIELATMETEITKHKITKMESLTTLV